MGARSRWANLMPAFGLPFSAFIASRRRHRRLVSDWSSDVCSSDLSSLQFAQSFRAVVETIVQIVGMKAIVHQYFWQIIRIMVRQEPCHDVPIIRDKQTRQPCRRSEERRVGKEGRFRWSPDH